jgi:transglutaminase-like putative cysteine protease
MRPSRELLLTGLTTATIALALSSWTRVVDGLGDALGPLVAIAVLVAATGAALRLASAPRWVTGVVPLALAWSVVSLRLAHSPIPLRHTARLRLEDAFLAAGNAAARSAPPVPVLAGVLAFVLCGAAAAFVLGDFLARTLQLPALGGLVLLAVLTVPISIVGSQEGIAGAARTGVSPVLFALVVAGYLAQIVIAEGDRLNRWGRQLDPAGSRGPEDRGRATPRTVTNTVAVGGAATALALAVPLLIPTMHLHLQGIGAGSGGGRITVTNPMVDVRRNLVQGADVPLVRVRTDDPDPSYLRIAVLARFTSNQWSAGDRSIPRDHQAQGAIPIPGLATSTPIRSYDYHISITPTFASLWLPTPAPISTISASGDWRYDASTEDFVAASQGLTTAGLSYSAVRAAPDLSASLLDGLTVGDGQVPALFTQLPPDLPKLVSDLAERVTRNAATPFDKAVALQDWFRDTGNFSYSTETALGSGTNDLVRFLTPGSGGRTGYCQQFAAAMAAMARTLGIPSRVAVGFLAPQKQSDGSWIYSSHDMHAWPELYFAGAGWVRFEPTPAEAGTVIPGYAHNASAQPEVPQTQPGASAPAQPNLGLSGKPRATTAQPTGPAAVATTLHHHVARWVALGVLLVLVAAGLTLPRTVRRSRRRTRLRGSAEDAWTEVRDTAIDLGIPWADDVSPRTSRLLLERYVGTHEGHVALDRLLDAVERERYAAEPVSISAEDVRAALTGLEEGEGPDVVRRAAWWPRSVVRRQRARTAAPAHLLDRVG